MIYFDNAATTFPKPTSVIKEVNRCLKKYCGNPGRSTHTISLKASEAVYTARELVSNFFHTTSPERVVFTYNATYALNLAIKSYITHDCHVLTSEYEHNAVIRPLEKLKATYNIEYSTVPSESFNLQGIIPYLKSNTIGIIASIASNVAGFTVSLDELSKIAKAYNLFLIIDASQAAGHVDINLTKTPCDVLCAPAHKAMLGIQGCGFAIFADGNRKDSFIEGGSGSDSINKFMPSLLPEGYEAGTLATPSIVSLGCGIRFINDIGLENMQFKLNSLVAEAYNILSSFSEIEIYPIGNSLLSFNYDDIPSDVISYELDRMGICTRAGLHCAPLAHEKLGTLSKGTVRLSFSHFNKKCELVKLYKALKFIKKAY